MLDSDNHSETQKNALSPIDELDTKDPGDETQRNYAYQSAYGVILLVAAATEKKPYSALWCEHYEDFLGQRHDGLFNAYQVKTSRPENGDWTLTDDEIRKSIKRFIALELKYPLKIGDFHIVSNTEFSDSEAEKKIHKSPRQFLKMVKNISIISEIPEGFNKTFTDLADYCECTPDELLTVLKRVRLVNGPSRTEFETVISHDHISKLQGCENLDPDKLNGLRDELIEKVARASSLRGKDASRHWSPLDENDRYNPELLAKRIFVSEILEFVKEKQGVPFRLLAPQQRVSFDKPASARSFRLEQKLNRGGLSTQLDSMQTKMLSSEYYFHELAQRNPKDWEKIYNHLENFVKGECDEAQLDASQEGIIFGQKMFTQLSQRLRIAMTTRQNMVHGVEYECLMGLAALLTSECFVWWSEKFELERES